MRGCELVKRHGVERFLERGPELVAAIAAGERPGAERQAALSRAL